ncbi:MAG: RdgB/HAM1 family non-canonical purine NTP pyrophosphatase [Planctomycetota bacterium]|nr:RdgB/HAM1 family non-canonical purine NTP pyrophosphatase [Planctomycetota bacterium]
MTGAPERLLLASGNPKKLKELTALLGPLGIQLVTPAEVGGLDEVVEDRPDFRGNAAKKAVAAAQARGMWSLADDSGLEVDHLDGAPGVYSARYAGTHGDDAANNARLLRELAGVPRTERGARFVCALALARPDGTLAAELQGTCRGVILEAERGDNDFGYDPLFEFDEPGHAVTGRSFAELEGPEKAAVSHRGRALRELTIFLQDLLGQRA